MRDLSLYAKVGYYREQYDVIVIGAALAGLSAAITLRKAGKSVLILERHNLPGGVATSFVRGGVELEATLHEMMEIGPKESRRRIGKVLSDLGAEVDWIPVPDAYHLSIPGVEQTFHTGFERFAKEADQVCPGCYDQLLEFLQFCREVSESATSLQAEMKNVLHILRHHLPFVRTLGYSVKEVMDAFRLPDPVRDLISPYWLYVGSSVSELPFTVYAVVMNEYIGYGAYIPRHTSHEMALRLAESAESLGVQIEYRQTVEKIILEDGKASAVRTRRGDVIRGSVILSGAYPHTVFRSMLEPVRDLPRKALKTAHSREMNLSAFSVVLLLDQPKEALNLQDYCIFRAPHMQTEQQYEELLKLFGERFSASVCLNAANPETTPEGTCFFSTTIMPRVEAWQGVKPEDYDRIRHEIAEELLDEMSAYLGVSLRDHILEIVIETPVTISHYTGAHLGGVYGYKHSLLDHTVARTMQPETWELIPGLYFTGAHGAGGDGMAPCIGNGVAMAKRILGKG